MKKYCKNIDITDRSLIERSVLLCLDRKNKKRRDIKSLIKQYPEIRDLITQLQSELINEKLEIKPIWYTTKIDVASRKERNIGIQDIKQQIYDYIAVEGLRPVFCMIGEYQCASIPHRGPIKGTKVIRKWLRNPSLRYVGKADIKKCYESIPKEKLMDFLRKHVKNDKLLWLVGELIDSFENGLSIGSYLSQYLCNLYLSELYHYISEQLYRTRTKRKSHRTQRISLVKHVLFYMDDIFVLGTNAKDINMAIKKIREKLAEMGLKMKPNWEVYKTSDGKFDNGQFIDMMGFRIYQSYTTLRRGTFLRLRRAFKKAQKHMSLKAARRCISYWGYIENSNSYKLMKKYKMDKTVARCRKEVSKHDKGKIRCQSAASKNYSNWQKSVCVSVS